MNNQRKTIANCRNAIFFRMMLVIAFMLFSGSVFCQAPALRTTSSFAAFTAVGGFSSLGATNITGDIGTDVGVFNGFPPGTIIGQTSVADAISAQVAVDVDLAYNELLVTTCGVVIGTTLGSGQILTPEVYCTGAASILDGSLTFDALGNADAIFIIKIDGAFETTASSSIILANSASACNIYWQINGQVTLGDNSVFKGTVIADGAIILLEASTIDGRLLSKAGAISLNNNLVTLSCNEIILPVELYSFFVECENQKAILYWNTASETNNRDFTVECSSDAINWETIGIVNGNGNTSTISQYSFIHENPYPLTSYYRLKQTDFDEKFQYSAIIALESYQQDILELSVFPTPVNNILFLNYTGDADKTNSITVYNSSGQLVYTSYEYQSQLDLSDNKAGIYFLHFNHSSGTIVKRIVLAGDSEI